MSAFLGCISLPSFDCFRLRSFSTGLLARSPRTFVPADGFFLIFIFLWKGWFRSVSAFLGCISLPSFDCFRLRSFSTGLLARSPRTFVPANGFFLIFIFLWKGWFRSVSVFLGCISLPSFDCFRLRSFSTGFLCQSPRAEAGSCPPAFASPPNPLSEKQC